MLISLNFKHLPSKHYINSALVALFQSNFICVWESVNFLVWSPVLDASVVCSAAVKLILSHKMLVVKGVEISAFTLIRELGWVTNQVAVSVVPSMQEVAWNCWLMV
jgi:hypothetical protein